MKVTPGAALDAMNTLRLPARAQWLAEPETPQELAELLADPRFRDLPRTVLGEGSNLVLADDLPGLVIRPRLSGVGLLEETGDRVLVEVMAGENWDAVVCHSLAMGWQGLENLSLIPGSAGAAPFQNIGAYGVELSDFLESLTAVRLADGKHCEFSREDCRFGYRDSLFKSQCPGEYLITSLRLRLNLKPALVLDYEPLPALRDLPPGELDASRVRETVCAARRAKLPDPNQLANAGSFFKNPVVSEEKHNALKEQYPDLVSFPVSNGHKLAAGWLVEHAGWKGKRQGPLGMHERQALVLVNHGGATGADVLAFAEQVRADVRERFGVELEREPVVLPRGSGAA